MYLVPINVLILAAPDQSNKHCLRKTQGFTASSTGWVQIRAFTHAHSSMSSAVIIDVDVFRRRMINTAVVPDCC